MLQKSKPGEPGPLQLLCFCLCYVIFYFFLFQFLCACVCVHIYLYVCGHTRCISTHVSACTYMWRPTLVLRIIWYCFPTLFNETGSFNPAQRLLTWLFSPVSLLWGLPFPSWASSPPRIYVDFSDLNSSLQTCAACSHQPSAMSVTSFLHTAP